jgi:hypothetical protein
VLRGEKVLAPVPEIPLQAMDIVRTEKGGSLQVTLSDNSTLLLLENTELRIVEYNPDAQKTVIELLHGHVLSQNTPVVKAGGMFQIKTPTAIVVALGTSLEVATTPAASTVTQDELAKLPIRSGRQDELAKLAVKSDDAGLAGADVALVLANMNKVSLGKTDAQGNVPSPFDLANGARAGIPALELANLGKVPLHAEVDDCEDGSRQVYLVGADGKLPPTPPKCKRRRLSGTFFWTAKKLVTVDLTKGMLLVTDMPTLVTPSYPGSSVQNLNPVEPSSASGSWTSLADHTAVTSTTVTALDHFVGVTNFDSKITGVSYLLPGQQVEIPRGQPPRGINLIRENEFGSGMVDFGADHRPCQPAIVVNGETVAGVPKYHYKITGLGTSTGNALQLQITNTGGCALYFLITDGTIFHPKGFTERVITGILLGGTPKLKDFQKMITMGLFLRLGASGALGAGPAAPAPSEATIPLRAYCVELHKLAPHPKTEYRIGDAEDQQKLGVNRSIVDKTFSMVQTHQLSLPSGHSMDSVIQWSLWSKIEGMEEKKFMEEFNKLVKKNYEVQKKKWDKTSEQQTEQSGHSLWGLVSQVLR